MTLSITGDYVVAANETLTFYEQTGIRADGSYAQPTATLTNYGYISNVSLIASNTIFGNIKSVHNYGTIYSENTFDYSYGFLNRAIGSGVLSVYNDGDISARGSKAYGVSTFGILQNAGNIHANGQTYAIGVNLRFSIDAPDIPFINDGLIQADASGDGVSISSATGVVLDGITTAVNTGSILASASGNGSESVGISYSRSLYSTFTFSNSGVITADWAIQQFRLFDSLWTTDQVSNSGTLNGKVDLGRGDDALSNSGWINDAVYLGVGNDIYDGAAAKSGVLVYGDYGDDTLTGGSNVDQFFGGDGSDTLTGQLGFDLLTGGAGVDTFKDTTAGLNGDRITDFSVGDRIVLTDANLSGFSYQLSGSTLTYTGGGLTLDNLPGGARMLSRAASGGGVELYLAAAPAPGVFNADFNGDGRSDVFWRNDNGWISSWLGQAGGGFLGDSAVSGVVPTDWKVIGVGDFNGDGKSDLFWRNDNATVASWLSQAGGGFIQDAAVGGVVPADWKITGIGDFNGDGKDDIFWRNDSGAITSWLGQGGGGFVGDSTVSGTVPTDWKVVTVGDFNGDGRSDLFWRSDSGGIAVWQGQAGGFVGAAAVSGTVANTWTVVGAGDFNGDGRSDLLWRNDTGEIAGWAGQADGSFAGIPGVSGVVPNDWKIANIGDFNGDGRADIFWRNDSGQLAGWLGKAGGGFNQDAAVGGTVSTDWWTI